MPGCLFGSVQVVIQWHSNGLLWRGDPGKWVDVPLRQVSRQI